MKNYKSEDEHTLLIDLKHHTQFRRYQCEYKIICDYRGYSLYRKLFPGEEKYYVSELQRLRIEEYGEIWLHLQSDTNLDVLQSKLKKLNGH